MFPEKMIKQRKICRYFKVPTGPPEKEMIRMKKQNGGKKYKKLRSDWKNRRLKI